MMALSNTPKTTTYSFKKFVIEFLLTLLFNSLIAIFLTVLNAPFSLLKLKTNFIISQAIGLCIFFLSIGLQLMRQLSKSDMSVFVITIPLGGVFGVLIASGILGYPLPQIIVNAPALLSLLACILVFGTIIAYYFYTRSTIAEKSLALQEAHLQQLAHEKQLTETRLKLLQAQIEPHFLFNTLSNVLSLIDEEPKRASLMLENFTKYLRVSLRRTRQEQATLKDELELVRTYLDIHTIRMGERLQYHIDVPEIFHSIHLPPLLLQPLVENALKHGLAPKLEGGAISISANTKANRLDIAIMDTGIGFQKEHGTGMGLNNVRARLRAFYGNQAKIHITENTPGGVSVNLSIPLGEDI
jgi:sensor histidine kinase YesM